MKTQNINHAMGELGKYTATDLLSHSVNRDLGLVYWDVKPCEVIPYAQSYYHTVSLYTRGGEKTRRMIKISQRLVVRVRFVLCPQVQIHVGI